MARYDAKFPGIHIVGNLVNREASSLLYAWDAAVCDYYVGIISSKDWKKLVVG